MIRARAWCRADLGGGTLDIWPLSQLFSPAVTVNVALDLPVEVSLEARREGYRVRQDGQQAQGATVADLECHPDGALVGVAAAVLGLPPVAVEIASASPRGGGLGASSAATVALIAAADRLLGREQRTPAAMVHLARDLEARLMRLPTGMQDHYPAVLGGALAIRHRPGGEAVEALEIDLEGLSRHLVIAYSGRSHFSAATNWQIIRGCLDGEAAVRGLFEGIAEVAAGLPDALRSGDWAAVGELVRREWSLRRHLADGVSVPAVESLLELAQSLGAWGGKACGAGGGGCVALLVPAKRREVVARSLELAGGRVLPARPTVRSLEVTGEG
jgi:D-glycero-alpha-D-manno-heptose-7-phosphate kinase